MGMDKQGSKPTGFIGKIIGWLMNKAHTSLYVEYLMTDLPPDNSKILDIGCGGGKFLKFLSDANDSYLLFGLDHSPEMIELSKKVNQKAIDRNKLAVIQGSVLEIPLENSFLDFVTAFETVQFWPNLEKSFAEIRRVLKNSGSFLIINRYPAVGSKWWKLVKIKSDQEYIRLFKNAGFSEITIDLDFKKGWVIAKAIKE